MERGKIVVEFFPSRFRRASGDRAVASNVVSTNHIGRIGEALGGSEFAVSVNALRATFALRSRLTRNGPWHFLRQVCILDFHGNDFIAPWFRLLIDDLLEIRVEK
jgi:hypothetical protein